MRKFSTFTDWFLEKFKNLNIFVNELLCSHDWVTKERKTDYGIKVYWYCKKCSKKKTSKEF